MDESLLESHRSTKEIIEEFELQNETELLVKEFQNFNERLAQTFNEYLEGNNLGGLRSVNRILLRTMDAVRKEKQKLEQKDKLISIPMGPKDDPEIKIMDGQNHLCLFVRTVAQTIWKFLKGKENKAALQLSIAGTLFETL